MKKTFMGVRLKRLREEHQLNQIDLARALEISPSYLNQLERNQRPLTVPVLLKINAVFGVDVQFFSEDDEARLIANLREYFQHQQGQDAISLAEIHELASNMPAVAKTLLRLAKSQRASQEHEQALAYKLGLNRSSGQQITLQPFEEVRDFFYSQHNYIDHLDKLAEALAKSCQLSPNDAAETLQKRLKNSHNVRVIFLQHEQELPASKRQFDPKQKTLMLSSLLNSGQAAFQMATQLAYLEALPTIEALCHDAKFSTLEAERLARIGLAHYFAGALLMPYQMFLQSAEAMQYDIELLARQFNQSFEATCHRLSTLQRPGERGIPFFFIRVDRAGNISKRQSATDFHFSRIGGTCPLWNVYEAFEQPGKVLTQLAAMPDGRAYLWVASSITHRYGGYGASSKTFSIGLGCDLQHAKRLVYSKGLDLSNRERFTPIGAGCKVCPRKQCPQRAFPTAGNNLLIDENHSQFTPYPAKQ